jgi:ubiquinone/menaquinone biosynthesis C-methylase UbiE
MAGELKVSRQDSPKRWDEFTHKNKKLYECRQRIMGYFKKVASLTPWYDEKIFNRFQDQLSQIYHELLPGAVVLDVGSGPGALSGEFCEHYGAQYYVGADYSAGMARDAKADFPGQAFVCADVGSLPFADNSFDIVHSAYLLHHLKPRDRARAIKEKMRVARRAVVIVDCFGFASGFWRVPYWAYYTLVDGSYHRYAIPEWQSMFEQVQGKIARYCFTDERTVLHRIICWVIVP